MDTKKLRQKILDLAIHGKLVPQDPNDEPASVLLERIRAEKERLIKEGKIKKPKKSATSDTPRYENPPNGWCVTTLGDVFSLQAGKNISSSDINDYSQKYPYPCYGGNGIRGYVSSYNHEGNYPIIGRQGALCGNVNYAQGKFYATEHAVVVTCFSGVDVDWVRYTFEAMNLNQYATATAQPGLSVATVNDVTILLPPLKEQKRISKKLKECLDYIDVLCKNTSEFRLAIDIAKSKILDLAIQGKLASQDPNDEPASELLKRHGISSDSRPYGNVPFELPDSWCWISLGSITNYGSCVTIDVNTLSDKEWVLELEDIEKDTGLIINKFSRCKREIKGVRHKFTQSNVLYSKLRTYLNKVLVAPTDGYCTTEIIPIQPAKCLLADYLAHVLRSRYFLDYTAQCVYGVKMPRLSTTDAQKGLIPIPPLAEQKRIVAKVNELFSQLDHIVSSL